MTTICDQPRKREVHPRYCTSRWSGRRLAWIGTSVVCSAGVFSLFRGFRGQQFFRGFRGLPDATSGTGKCSWGRRGVNRRVATKPSRRGARSYAKRVASYGVDLWGQRVSSNRRGHHNRSARRSCSTSCSGGGRLPNATRGGRRRGTTFLSSSGGRGRSTCANAAVYSCFSWRSLSRRNQGILSLCCAYFGYSGGIYGPMRLMIGSSSHVHTRNGSYFRFYGYGFLTGGTGNEWF